MKQEARRIFLIIIIVIATFGLIIGIVAWPTGNQKPRVMRIDDDNATSWYPWTFAVNMWTNAGVIWYQIPQNKLIPVQVGVAITFFYPIPISVTDDVIASNFGLIASDLYCTNSTPRIIWGTNLNGNYQAMFKLDNIDTWYMNLNNGLPPDLADINLFISILKQLAIT